MLDDPELRRLAASRWRVALVLTVAMLVIYFGFIVLAAFAKPWMGRPISDGAGLSWGILLGAVVIVAAFILTGAYVMWANRHYDPEVRRMAGRAATGPAPERLPPGGQR
jgi:uncharacterized membrane protein (DUF485 family)